MRFDSTTIKTILSNTPNVINALFHNLPDSVINRNEGGESWSPKQIMGHLIGEEKLVWIPRTKFILENGPDETFEAYDMKFQDTYIPDKSIEELLNEFKFLRIENMKQLENFELKELDLQRTAIHPHRGRVMLSELLTTWAVHDLAHIAQISRVISKQYKEAVGPWKVFRILQ